MTHRVGLSFQEGPLLRVKPELLGAHYLVERSALCLTSKGIVVLPASAYAKLTPARTMNSPSL